MTDTVTETKVNPSDYPSVDLAYEFVKPSYDWMIRRIEAMNAAIQYLITLAVTIIAAFPVVAKLISPGINFVSPLFIVAMVLFASLVVIGCIAIRMGRLSLLNPKVLYDKYLYLSHWEFQQQTLYFAGEQFIKNNNRINKKANMRDFMTILLLVEIILLIIWIAV